MLVAAVVAPGLAWAWKRSVAPAMVILLIYLSHPAVDYVTGLNSMWWHGPNVGLHFVERPFADLAIQVGMCVVGFVIYVRSLRQQRRRELITLTPLVLLLALQGLSGLFLRWEGRGITPN